MMTIRQQQMAILDAQMMRRYEERVLRKITQRFPDRYPPNRRNEALLLVQAGIRAAARVGIEEDDDVERFLLLVARHGLDFATPLHRVECRGILDNPNLPGDAKVSLLERELAAELVQAT
jgi:hypothetical protein